MVSLIGVGDNTVDRYIDMNMMYPGGNAVNVSVFFKRMGGEASYLGWLGDDRRGHLIMDSLRAEGVDVSQCRLVAHPTGRCDVKLQSGDRHFIGSIPGARKLIHLTEPDFDHISSHDITHTSIYSFIEPQLQELKHASDLLSFDYSSDWTNEYLKSTLPHVDAAFLSSSNLNDFEVEKIIKWVQEACKGLAVITRGIRGSIAYDGHEMVHQGTVETDVIDTLGAGDSFIARLLYETQKDVELGEAMYLAAESAEKTCTYYGAWGYGVPIEEP